MFILKLALKNIRQDFKSYTTYLISTTFSVMIFFIFCTLFYNEQFVAISQSKIKLDMIMKGSALIVALFSAIFVWYSNSFFLKRRKKEIATYMLLGVKKHQIGGMLFCENIILGLLSLIFGTLLGILLARYFTVILLNLMLDAAQIKFIFTWKAIFASVVVFTMMFLFNSLYSYSITYRLKLIDLFVAQKEGEKKPKASTFRAILSILLILSGYIIAITFAEAERSKLPLAVFTVILTVVVGTYMLFNNFIVFFVKKLSENKKFHYRGNNIIATSQILYRIKGNAVTLATIALLSSVTLTAITAAVLYYKISNQAIREHAPFSVMHISDDQKINAAVMDNIKKFPDNPLLSYQDITIISGISNTPLYLGPFGVGNGEVDCNIMSLSEYNKCLELQKRTPLIKLENDEMCYFLEMNVGTGLGDVLHNQPLILKTPGLTKNFKIIDNTILEIINDKFYKTTVVVTDNVFNMFLTAKGNNNLNLRGYMVGNDSKSKELSEKLSSIVPESKVLDTHYDFRVDQFKLAGIYIFIGMFVGVLFLLATGSIIYFKQLLEANDDKSRYKVLQNIGVSDKEIRQIVKKQHIAVFGMPLIVGVCHSSVAFYLLQIVSWFNLTQYFIYVLVFYIFMYLIYYIVTVNSYTKIVTSKI